MRIISEQRTIELTINMNSIDSIYNDLLKLGVRNGDILLVHSSPSSSGWVCGGTQAVMALKHAVGKSGALVMPAHSGEISDPAEWSNPPVPEEWIKKIYLDEECHQYME